MPVHHQWYKLAAENGECHGPCERCREYWLSKPQEESDFLSGCRAEQIKGQSLGSKQVFEMGSLQMSDSTLLPLQRKAFVS